MLLETEPVSGVSEALVAISTCSGDSTLGGCPHWKHRMMSRSALSIRCWMRCVALVIAMWSICHLLGEVDYRMLAPYMVLAEKIGSLADAVITRQVDVRFRICKCR